MYRPESHGCAFSQALVTASSHAAGLAMTKMQIQNWKKSDYGVNNNNKDMAKQTIFLCFVYHVENQ